MRNFLWACATARVHYRELYYYSKRSDCRHLVKMLVNGVCRSV